MANVLVTLLHKLEVNDMQRIDDNNGAVAI
jgi:hypothetical protein